MAHSKADTLDLAALGLLLESPLHGYELRKRLNLVLGWSRVLSYGSLYPALKRMLRDGLINEAYEPNAAIRRQRITYEITDLGRAHFATKMADAGPSAWEDDNFSVHFSFFSRTDHAVRMQILEGRRIRLQERLERIGAASQRTDRYAAELHRHSRESIERELAWLNGVIDVERNSADRRGDATPDTTPTDAAPFGIPTSSRRPGQPAPDVK